MTITQEQRALQKNQYPIVLWFTGISGAGKSTIASLVDQKLNDYQYHTYFIDGDDIRRGLNSDLGFTNEDRAESSRRVAEVARHLVDAGLMVLIALISPFRLDRAKARALFKEGQFVEIFVDTPLRVAEHRDVKGLYLKARRGEVAFFTGVDSTYEVPDAPEICICTESCTADAAAANIVAKLCERGLISQLRGNDVQSA